MILNQPSNKSLLLASVATLLLASAAPVVHAGDALIDEARFGGVWQNPDFLDKNHPEDNGVALSGELFFAPFSDTDARDMTFGDAIFAPRIVVGANVALGQDDTSSVYSAVAWQFGVTDAIFIEASFGISANNGDIDGNAADTRAKYGSNVLFRETLALGVQLTEQWNAVLEVEHQSHASLFGDHNRGLTNLNVKLGYKF
ncbi:MAG: acyloxyacyl hydrolase [Pseudomonadota bacterium]